MSEIFIILGLILLNGVFAMSEIALISARKSKLTADAGKGNKGAKTALKLAEEPDRFLSTVQIGITLIGILTGIYSGNTIAVLLGEWLVDLGMSITSAFVVGQTLIVVVVTYLTLIFGELVPKRIGLSVAERVSKLVARPMQWLSVAASPFVWLLAKSTSGIFGLLGIRSTDSKVTEEEIKSIIREGTDGGEVQPVEQNIVERVFLLGDLGVDSIMTHKNDIVWLDVRMTAGEVMEVLRKNLYEVYPIADGDLDHVKGIITLKDLFLHLDSPDFNLAALTREAASFYENTHVYKAMEQMKAQNISRGLVYDEFGSCIGILTLKDVLDGLIGTVGQDEGEEPCILPRQEGEGWLVDGRCTLYDFLSYFNKQELFENGDFTTVAGLIIDRLGYIPKSGDHLDWKSFSFEVVDMDGARIDKVLVKLLPIRAEE